MKDFSKPPYGLAEIGRAAYELADTVGVAPVKSHLGGFSLTAIAETLVRIGEAKGISIPKVNSLSDLGIQLQKLLS